MKKINYMMLSCLFVLLGSCTEEVQQKGEQPAPEGGSDAITRQEVTLNLKKQTGTRPGENQRRNNRFRRRECHLDPRCICVRFRNGKRRLLFHGTVRLPTIIKQQ